MTEFNIEKNVRVIHGGNSGSNPTGKSIRAAWGEPDRLSSDASGDVWTYDTGNSVSGAMVGAYLPLGLAVPSGKNGIDFHFKAKATTPWRAVERTTGASGGYVDLVGGGGFQKVHQ